MLHSGKARHNRDKQRQSLVEQIRQQQLKAKDATAFHDPAADPRHVAFMQKKFNQPIH